MLSDSPTVLCAHPDAGERAETADALADAGLAVEEVGSVDTLDTVLDRSIDCVVTAFDFEDGDGFDVVDAVRGVNPAVWSSSIRNARRRTSPAAVRNRSSKA